MIGVAGTRLLPNLSLEHCLNNHTAFGRDVSWKEDTSIPPGHKLSYKDALHITTTNNLLRILVPDWAMGLTQKLRDTKQAYDEIHVSFKPRLPCSCAYWPFDALCSIALHERNGA